MIKFLDLHSQHQEIRTEIDEAIRSVIEDCAFIGGKYVRVFEQEFATYLGANHCVGVGNGTDALEIAIEALDLPSGSEIIVPGNSFVASSEAVTRTGCKVVFCDVDASTLTLDVSDVRSRVTDKTRAVMAVHLYGQPANMADLKALRDEFDIYIIEDCAQAHGSTLGGQKIGTIGDVAAFSFYPGKNLGAYGDAGAIVTANDAHAKRAQMIANHGRINKYDHVFEGRNSRLDGLQAAILSVKLRHLDNWTEKRIAVANWYDEGLKDVDEIVLPGAVRNSKHVYHLYVIRTPNRDELLQFLRDRDIHCGVHYPIALPKLKPYAEVTPVDPTMLINQLDSNLLSLPMGPHISRTDADMVCEAIKEFTKTRVNA